MPKANNYYVQKAVNNNSKIKELLLELPRVCTEYFISISQTTSPLTRLAYAYDLRIFFNYLCAEELSFANSSIKTISIEQLNNITSKEIAHFQNYLIQYVKPTDKESSPTLIQNGALGIMRKLCTLRSFFEYLFKNNLIKANIATLVELPKKKERPIIHFSEEEVQAFIQIVISGEGLSEKQKKYQSSTKNRDLAILMLFLGTGIRVSELVGLDLNSFDFTENAFVVTRKGGNQTILYFPDIVKDILLIYLDERRKVEPLKEHENAFFLSMQKKRITVRAVENLVKKYSRIAVPLKKKISPHKLRSTFGTSLYQKTGDIYLVADALGHADVNTTRKHYAAMSDKRKREAAKQIDLPRLKIIEGDKS